ncbi:MAG TPA: Crp/Fnr family transcriptional regulator, partial [Rhodoferax sp.]|nr:Crp/Fnr family transcriptional regulator [Rhodoferax sp.]
MKPGIEPFDPQRYLSVMPLFSDLSDAERARLASGCQLERLTRGNMVFRTGDVCDAFFVVILGQVKLYLSAPNVQEKVIEIVGPGRSFAEAMVLLEVPCILNGQSLTDALLLRVSKATVFSEIKQDPRFALRMLAGISRRLHGLVQDVEAYALHSGIQRLIGYLLSGIEKDSARGQNTLTVSLPASKATIASRLS